MFFTVSLYVALAIFGLGLVYKISTWLRYSIDIEAEKIPPSARALAAIKGIFSSLFSAKIIALIKVLVMDVILQVRILRQDFLRWLMHMCLYSGFMLPLSDIDPGFKGRLRQSDQAGTFLACFGCETCSTVCPVVAGYDHPREALGLLPHQIMHSCGLGLKDLALGSNMLWYCLTCYQCQEQCPQGVNVTDIIYELKNAAVEQVKKKVEL